MDIEPVDPKHYDREYYYKDNDGHREFQNGLDAAMHDKFKRFFDILQPSENISILDIGCGRGEIAYYGAQRGCRVNSVDYSESAVEIAKETVSRLSEEKKALVKIECLDVIKEQIDRKFDIIVMIDVLEHVTPAQAQLLFKKMAEMLEAGGKVYISTPNGSYEKYFYVFKHIIQYPWKPFKTTARFFSGKFKPKSISEFFEKAFRIIPKRSDSLEIMHVNVTTPHRLKKQLNENGFQVRFFKGNNLIDKEIVLVGEKLQ